jgi:hypothetical protein
MIIRRLRTTPIRSYRWCQAKRNWLLAKVEYLQAESAKWRATFNLIKLPYSALRALGLSPRVAGVSLMGLLATGSGVVVNETLLDEPSFSRGDSGIYLAPFDAPIFYSDGDNTLRLNLEDVPVEAVTIENATIGSAAVGSTLPSGETNVIEVGGLPVSAGFTETFLEVGHLIIQKNQCTKLTVTNTEAYHLNIKWNASDGQSISPSPGTPRARAIGGGNRSKGMVTSGGNYDQIKMQATKSGVNGKVDVFTFSGLKTKGGPCVFDRIKAGIVDILYNEVGAGNGLATKDFVVSTSTVFKNFTNTDNVEITINPP